MYYVEELAQFKSTINYSTEMYSVSHMNSFQNEISNLNYLENKQEVVLAKLRVLLHNIDNLAIKSNIKIQNKGNEENLMKLQDDIINRLKILISKIDQISPNHIKYESLQNNLNKRINDWRLKVEDLVSEKGIIVSEKMATINFSIFTDSIKPPLSVILLLSFLKTKGHKVAAVSYLKKVSVNDKISKINEYLNDNLSLNGSRLSYKLVLSIIWSKLDIDDCISRCYTNNNPPMFGEVVTLIYLCKCLSIDISKFITQMESINDDLLFRNNTKRALILLHKLSANVNGDCEENLALSAFIISCLVQSKSIGKIEASLRTNVDSVLKIFGIASMDFVNCIE